MNMALTEGSGRAMPARQVHGSIPKSVVSYVRRVMGPEAVAGMLAEVGSDLAGRLAEPRSWFSSDEVIRIAETAAAVCGEPDIGRRGGEETMRILRERGTVDFLLSTGSVAGALALAARSGSKVSDGRILELARVEEGHAVLIGTYVADDAAHPFWCGHSRGFYGLVPELFGVSAVIAEPECQCRGDARCVFEIRWTKEGADGARAEDVDASRQRTMLMIDRFEQLHRMATELAEAEDVDTLLPTIADRAGLAVAAPRYFLAVRTDAGDDLRVHQKGFDDTKIEEFIEKLEKGELVEHGRCVIGLVESARRQYGHLVAMYPRGSEASESDKRLLHAYARHVASVIESVASLESAREDRDTAVALLQLAEALSEVGTPAEVAARLAESLPPVVQCDHSSVWLWDPFDRTLTLAAAHAGPGSATSELPVTVLPVEDIDGFSELAAGRAPGFLGRHDAPVSLRKNMMALGLDRYVIMPMSAQTEFVGIVALGYREDHSYEHGQLLTRLRALADQGATALANAALVEQVRAQALQDNLTGLPNRVLIRDRTEQLLLRMPRSLRPLSLLFIDLDGFKTINDTLGHEVGDDLIRAAAARLGTCLRTSDTLARIGGDEFVVLLPDASDPVTVAGKIIDRMREPLELDGRQLFVTCSIGVATAPDHGTDFPTLLRNADAAMYRAKRAGRATFAVHSANPDRQVISRLVVPQVVGR